MATTRQKAAARSNIKKARKVQSRRAHGQDRKSTRLNSSHLVISYAVFCLKKKNISHIVLSNSHSRNHLVQYIHRLPTSYSLTTSLCRQRNHLELSLRQDTCSYNYILLTDA